MLTYQNGLESKKLSSEMFLKLKNSRCNISFSQESHRALSHMSGHVIKYSQIVTDVRDENTLGITYREKIMKNILQHDHC
jgi:hypothetical protein